MERSDEKVADILAQLGPFLEVLFYACALSEEEACEIVQDSCLALIAKRRLSKPDPEGWLLWVIVERCRAAVLGMEEEEIEDPPE
jgi:DNA-directed RNA polymerase specialized sigma24 family protein